MERFFAFAPLIASKPMDPTAASEPVYNGVDDARRAIFACEGGGEPVLLRLVCGLVEGALVRDPAGVDCCHENVLFLQLQTGCSRQHIQGCLCHVRVRVGEALVYPGKLPLHGRDVDNEFPLKGRLTQKRLESADEDEGRDGIHGQNLQQLPQRHLAKAQLPRVGWPCVHLLPLGIDEAFGEEGSRGVFEWGDRRG